MANKYLALWRETKEKLLFPFYDIGENRHKLVGNAKNWKFKRDFQISFLLQQGLKKDQEFIDIGCGTLRGGIPIIDYLDAGKYTGIDSRVEVIDEGKKELKEVELEYKNPDLMTISDLDKLRDDKKISGVPVTEDGKLGSRLVGLVSNRDTDFIEDRTMKLADVMTPIETLVTGPYPISIAEANEILKV